MTEEQHLEEKEKWKGVNLRNTFHDFENKKERNLSGKIEKLVENVGIISRKAKVISENFSNLIEENNKGLLNINHFLFPS